VAKVFVSYQRSDTLVLAHCLAYALRAAGHEAFVDTGAIPASAAFVPFIDEALARTELVLVLVGPAFDCARLERPTSAIAFEWRRARFHGCAVLPVLHGRRSMLAAAELPAELRWLPGLNARFVSDEALSADVDAIVALVPSLARPPRPSARVLWVDDNPKNNERERQYLRTQGVTFDNVVSTQEALEQLRNAPYDLVITDLGRATVSETSPLAGLAMLKSVIGEAGPPVIVYAGAQAVLLRAEVIRLGGLGSTNRPDDLYALVDLARGRTPAGDGALEP
jgi:CheY-like chemotaxis protein